MELLDLSRYFVTPLEKTGDREFAIWCAEYYGQFACRQFQVVQDQVLVAPYDMPFLDLEGLDARLEVERVRSTTLQTFEPLWEEFAQKRLDSLASGSAHPLFEGGKILHVRSPFPKEFKGRGEESSTIYTEWVDEVARRNFEIYPDHTEVSPYDITWPDLYELTIQAVTHGVDDGGNPLPPPLQPTIISYAEFERQWRAYAIARLRILAANSR